MRMHTPYQDDQCATLFDPAERTMIGAKVVNNVLVNSMKGEFQKDYITLRMFWDVLLHRCSQDVW